MKGIVRNIIIALVMLAVVGAAVVAWQLWPQSTAVLTDAETIRVPQNSAAVRDILWKPAERVADGINTAGDDYEPEVSRDGQTLIFVHGRPGENADLFICTQTENGWSAPTPMGEINSPQDELGPELSADGKTLYFYSNREGGFGGYDLWRARRGRKGWREPQNLGAVINSSYDDYGPALTPDGKLLYFSSNRPKPGEPAPDDHDAWSATLREHRQVRKFDLYSAIIGENGPQSVAPLNSLNTEFDEGSPAVSPYGDFLYFASNRPKGFGGFDLYRARRLPGGGLEAPTNLGETINTPANELDPELSMGGYGLYFSSDRVKPAIASAKSSTGQQPPSVRRDYDVFYSESREVFRALETHQASFDWTGLWRTIGPNFMWGVLALLLLLMLLALMRDFKNRKLSLLTRCLLVSLMAHMLLMLVFNAWQVGSAVAGALGGRGRARVTLVSTAMGQTIFTQIRGQFVDVASPIPAAASIEHRRMEVASAVEMPKPRIEHVSTQASPIAFTESSRVQSTVRDAAIPRSEPSLPTPGRLVSIVEHRTAPQAFAIPHALDQIKQGESASRPPVAAAAMNISRADAMPVRSDAVARRVDVPLSNGGTISETPGGSTGIFHTTTSDAAPAVSDSSVHIASLPAPIAPVRADVSNFGLPAAAVSPEAQGESAVVVRGESNLAGTTVRASLPAPTIEPVGGPQSRVFVAVEGHPVTGSNDRSLARGLAASDSADTSDRADRFVPTTMPASVVSGGIAALRAGDQLTLALPGSAPTGEARDSGDAPAEGSPQVAPQPGKLGRADGLAFGLQSIGEPVPQPVTIMPAGAPLAEQSMAAAGKAPVDARSASAEPGRPASVTSMSLAEAPPAAPPPELKLALPSDRDRDGGGILPPSAVGIIRGRISDNQSHEMLADAVVRLVLPSAQTVEAKSDSTGVYSMYVPPTPEFFALSASRGGYVPQTQNIRSANLSKEALTVDFELSRESEFVIALEDQPDVHHLGNDRFEGAINSRFQKESEGRTLILTFDLKKSQMPSTVTRAEIHLLARGVQCSHPIRINGMLVQTRLDNSPEDGSFGEFVAPFDPAWLIDGENTFKIRAESCRGDLDDFEFVNIQLKLIP